MEYGLWNFHGGFWPGGNGSNFSSTDVISRNFYPTVNNEMEPPTFRVTTPGNGSSGNLFMNVSPIQSYPTSLITNLEFLTVGHVVPVNVTSPSTTMPGQQDELSQSVALEGVPMASDFITEQSSMDSLTPTDSAMPLLLSHQQSHSNNNSSNNNNNNNNITSTTTNNNNNNNINDDNNNNDDEDDEDGDENEEDEDEDDNCSQMGKEDKMKIGGKDNEEIWEDINGQGTNIKLENNSAIDYLFQQSYQHPMYGMVFSKMSSDKREAGASDETEEEEDDNDDEIEEGVPQVRLTDSVNSGSPSIQNRSPGSQTIQNATSVNVSKNGYECGECGFVAETRPGLKKHISVFHPNPGDLRLKNTLLKKMSASSKCPMSSCRFRSSERNEMEVHMARHVTGEYKLNGKKRGGPLTPQRVRYEREEYRCQICAYSCTVEKAFYKHLKIHSVGRQMSNKVKISCVICGKDRSTEVDMNKHMKKHRDDRYFCCDICIFKTVQLKKLIQHRRMHTGEKPHLCPHCSYRSARRDNLRSHVRRVHKKDNLFCDTFSPRGLVLSEGATNNSTLSAAPIPAVDSVQQTPTK